MRIENRCALYVLRCSTNGAEYFGSAMNTGRRWRQHRYDLRHGKHSNIRLLRTWQKYGEESFTFHVLAFVEPSQRLFLEERLLLASVGHSHCLNISMSPMGGMNGRKHTPESKEKMRRGNIGRVHSAESRARISEGQRKRDRTGLGEAISRGLKRSFAANPKAAEVKVKISAGLRRHYSSPVERTKRSIEMSAWWARYRENN